MQINKSIDREKKLVAFLEQARQNADAFYFVGDIFDFWWEYKHVVPKGFIRFLGKVAEITDSGIPVYFFTGNHDIWMKDYFEKEIGVKIFKKEQVISINNKIFLIAHGDGLGKGDRSYKFLKSVFTNRFLQWCFTRLHPNFALWLGHTWSNNRKKKAKTVKFYGHDKEQLIQYAKEKLETEHFDYFIFGHRHYPMQIELSKNTQFVNIGDWLTNFTFAVFKNNKIELKTFKNNKIENFITDLSVEYKISLQ